MSDKSKLDRPWMVAVWPGMGNVALNAGIYLLAKLDMRVIAEVEAPDVFDVEQVEVKEGIVQKPRHPRNRLFEWTDPNKKHGMVIFLGEAQPPIGKYAFCRQLLAYARDLGVERIFTFAAMATEMHPEHPSRVFGAATERDGLEELKRLELKILEDGNIGGLNGVLLAAAAESELRGVCLLGEMPHIFAQLPFPKASLAILEVFTTMADLDLDLTELSAQARMMEQQLGEILARVEKQLRRPKDADEEAYEPEEADTAKEERVNSAGRERIEQLFQQAAKDRSKAFELKQELDRAGSFSEYEDRFLDLFKKPE
jgi:proteasome assembly chaperone (PAC2) family protein